MDDKQLAAGQALAARADALLDRIFRASAPVPYMPPKAPERFKPGTRHVHKGPSRRKMWAPT